MRLPCTQTGTDQRPKCFWSGWIPRSELILMPQLLINASLAIQTHFYLVRLNRKEQKEKHKNTFTYELWMDFSWRMASGEQERYVKMVLLLPLPQVSTEKIVKCAKQINADYSNACQGNNFHTNIYLQTIFVLFFFVVFLRSFVFLIIFMIFIYISIFIRNWSVNAFVFPFSKLKHNSYFDWTHRCNERKKKSLFSRRYILSSTSEQVN